MLGGTEVLIVLVIVIVLILLVGLVLRIVRGQSR
jgi:hypothetical protein